MPYQKLGEMPTGGVTPQCPDPIHDLADSLVAVRVASAGERVLIDAHAARAVAEDEASALRCALLTAAERVGALEEALAKLVRYLEPGDLKVGPSMMREAIDSAKEILGRE